MSQLSRSSVGRVSGAVWQRFSGSWTVRASGRFVRRQLWAWPVLAAAVCGGVGWWVDRSVEGALREQRAAELNTMVDASVTSLRVWAREQGINVDLTAADEHLRPLVAELLQLAEGGAGAERRLVQAPAQETLRARLKRPLETTGYVGYLVVSPGGVVVAADHDLPVGGTLAGYRKEIFDRALAGKTLVSRPFRSAVLLPDEAGNLRANLPTMFTAGPLRDDQGKPVAALGLRIRPEHQFTRILQVVRFGKSGEAYAFDRNGLLLSQSRFDEELKQIGLLVDQPDSRSILTLEIRDPQVDMAGGERPRLRRAEQPLTRLAAEAVQGKDGYDADGYRDYRGVPSVGAWRWLPDYDFGVAAEVDVAEAFRPAYILRRAFWTLIALFVLCAAGIFLAMLVIARQQRALHKATLAARQLGQYALEEKLGAGGMGTVYKARHAMLRRPTAIKLLNVENMSDAAIHRFEREVQLTSGLTHPHTVAIFDYGRTPDGIFYYAMEYLEGMNLEDLVGRFGPLPEARAVFVLRQVCEALAEAHQAGLVHRDIKPANIFLTRRGGIDDFVKVLDFGLAKALDGRELVGVTSLNAVVGTPHYISPEAVNHPEQVNARSDVYAVAAVGYYLLTGTPVFRGTSVMEVCMKHVQEDPEPPSARRGRSVSPGLEALILRCLAKAPAERPADAADLLHEFEACAVEGSWTARDAAAWWAAEVRAVPTVARAPEGTARLPGVEQVAGPDATAVFQESTGSESFGTLRPPAKSVRE